VRSVAPFDLTAALGVQLPDGSFPPPQQTKFDATYQDAIVSRILGEAGYLGEILEPGTAGDDFLAGRIDAITETFAIADEFDALGGFDAITGGPFDDTLNGGDGDDILMRGDGDDVIDGGPGDFDVLHVAGTFDQYGLTEDPDTGDRLLTRVVPGQTTETDRLRNVEYVSYAGSYFATATLSDAIDGINYNEPGGNVLEGRRHDRARFRRHEHPPHLRRALRHGPERGRLHLQLRRHRPRDAPLRRRRRVGLRRHRPGGPERRP
jgi:hypothetical protein